MIKLQVVLAWFLTNPFRQSKISRSVYKPGNLLFVRYAWIIWWLKNGWKLLSLDSRAIKRKYYSNLPYCLDFDHMFSYLHQMPFRRRVVAFQCSIDQIRRKGRTRAPPWDKVCGRPIRDLADIDEKWKRIKQKSADSLDTYFARNDRHWKESDSNRLG